MKVYLQKPWKFSDSPYYKNIKENPPEDIEYANLDDFGLIQNKTKMKVMGSVKQIIKNTIKKFIPSLPNAHFTKNAHEYDLIHCTHCLSKNKHPWICDTEWVGQFWVTGKAKDYSHKKEVLSYLESTHCKKILAWTEWAKEGIVKEFPAIRNKVEVVYPGIPIQKRHINKNIKLLFVSRRFYFKGGLYAIEIMDKITKKYKNVEGIIVSDIPKSIKEKYSANKKLLLLDMMSQKKLFNEIYSISNIFIYPSLTDTFGFPITEAISFGLPVVGVDTLSRKELIKDNHTGFLVDSIEGMTKDLIKETKNKMIDDMIVKVSILIENKELREHMSDNAMKSINQGKFSIKNRNNNLKRIYNEALK
jgi:glycosyltransferase involved in cell wall biosynthesis